MNATYGRTDWGQFNTFGISEISVSKGYTSPIYGMNTLGGAVNMVTSKPTKELEIMARYNFVSNNEHRANLLVGGNLGKYYYQASYAFTHRDSFNLSQKFTPTSQWQGKGERENSYLTNHTLRAKFGFEPNENHEYSINLTYQKGQKGGLMSSLPFSGGFCAGQAECSSPYWRWPNYDKVTAYVIGNSKLSESLSLNSRVYYDSFYNVLNMLGRKLPNGTTGGNPSGNSTYDDYAIGGIFTLLYDFDENKKLKGGLNLKHNKHQSKDRDANGVSTTQDESTLKELSTLIFGEYAHRLNDTLRFMVSASYDRNDMLYGLRRNLGDATSNYAITEERIDTNALQGGTLQAILYSDWNDSLQSWFNVGHKTTLPSLRQRFSAANGYLTPNPNLQPESAINVELGTKLDYDFQSVAFSSTKAEVAVFYNDLTNMFVQTNDVSNACPNGASCSKFINAKEGYSYGVEVSFMQGFWDDKIKFGANYTYTQKKTTGAHFTNYDRILNYPNHIANAHFSISPIRVLDFILNASYHSPRWSYSNTTGNYTQSIDIFLLDLKLNYRIISGLEASVGAYNLLDYNYYFNAGEYMPGRRIFAGLEYRF